MPLLVATAVVARAAVATALLQPRLLQPRLLPVRLLQARRDTLQRSAARTMCASSPRCPSARAAGRVRARQAGDALADQRAGAPLRSLCSLGWSTANPALARPRAWTLYPLATADRNKPARRCGVAETSQRCAVRRDCRLRSGTAACTPRVCRVPRRVPAACSRRLSFGFSCRGGRLRTPVAEAMPRRIHATHNDRCYLGRRGRGQPAPLVKGRRTLAGTAGSAHGMAIGPSRRWNGPSAHRAGGGEDVPAEAARRHAGPVRLTLSRRRKGAVRRGAARRGAMRCDAMRCDGGTAIYTPRRNFWFRCGADSDANVRDRGLKPGCEGSSHRVNGAKQPHSLNRRRWRGDCARRLRACSGFAARVRHCLRLRIRSSVYLNRSGRACCVRSRCSRS